MKRHIVCYLLLSLVLTLLAVSAYAITIDLGTAANFGLLAGSTITNTGSSVINGDVGVSPGTAVTGFGPGVYTGTLHTGTDAVAIQAQLDLTTAYNAAAGAARTMTLTGQDLGGMTLTPGVFFFASDAYLTGNLTLQGNGDPNAQWIFQIGTALTTAAANTSVTLIDGATKCQVFWQVGSSATIGEGVFAGSIMADQSISLGGGTLNGRALARNAAVTISAAETVNAGPCAVVPEPSSLVALGMMLIPAGVLLRRRK